MSMDINAKRGDEVVFAHPDAGYKQDQEQAKKHLIEGSRYTVEYTDVHNWHTDVKLLGIPGLFNSVLFDNCKKKKIRSIR